jgi:hypothetical protein
MGNINKKSFSGRGNIISWGAELKDKDGNLIVRLCSIESPTPPTCIKFACLWKFFIDTIRCGLISTYHSRRVLYAQSKRGDKILDRYRTGEPSPKTIWQAIHANIKITCPVCRKYNIDPFLGGNNE